MAASRRFDVVMYAREFSNSIFRSGWLLRLAVPLLVGLFYLSAQRLAEVGDRLDQHIRAGTIYWQAAGMAFFAIAALPQLLDAGRKGALPWRDWRKSAWLMAIFLLYLVFSTTISINPLRSLYFIIGFLVFVLCLHALWTGRRDERRATYILTAASILIASAYLFTVLPMSDRTVGGVPANHFSHGAALAFILAFISRSPARWPVYLISLVLLGFANGRTAMASLLVFFAVYWLCGIRSDRQRFVKAIPIALGILAIALFCLAFFGPQIEFAIAEILKLGDPDRGLGSGFSGRIWLWQQFGEVIDGRELFGLGVETREGANFMEVTLTNDLHSGVLNAIVELGAVGTMAFAALVIVSALVWWRRGPTAGFEANCAFAYLVAMAPRLAIEPVYLSFWHPPQVIFWLFIVGACVPVPGDRARLP